jgi:hypothetical protein
MTLREGYISTGSNTDWVNNYVNGAYAAFVSEAEKMNKAEFAPARIVIVQNNHRHPPKRIQ